MGFPCAVTTDLNHYLNRIDDADRREAAITALVTDLVEEYRETALREAERIINEGCQRCYGSGCRACEGGEE